MKKLFIIFSDIVKDVIDYMPLAVILALILSFMIGCRAKQVQKESHYQEQTTEQKNLQKELFSLKENSVNNETHKTIDENTEVTIKKTTYDTSKPVDPVTGKHPILEESDITINSKKNSQEDSKKEENNQTTINELEVDKGEIEIILTKQTKELKSSSNPPLKKFLI